MGTLKPLSQKGFRLDATLSAEVFPASKHPSQRQSPESGSVWMERTVACGSKCCGSCDWSSLHGWLLRMWGGASTYEKEIKSGLEDAGYRVPDDPLRLSASDFGAPHLRRRLFWIANRDEPRLAISGFRGPPKTLVNSWRAIDRNIWLSSLAGVVRVADGVPGGVDRSERITAIGNAVVPQMAEWIGRKLIAMHTKNKS